VECDDFGSKMISSEVSGIRCEKYVNLKIFCCSVYAFLELSFVCTAPRTDVDERSDR
jgi:hypothetical protein